MRCMDDFTRKCGAGSNEQQKIAQGPFAAVVVGGHCGRGDGDGRRPHRHAGAIVAGGRLVVMLAVRRLAGHEEERPRLKQWLRVVLLFLGAYLTARYFFWRTFTTLSYYDFASYCAALALYAAEVYGIAIYFLGMFVNAQPLWREPVPLPDDQTRWPSVDVLIPTYDEDPDLLQVTLLAATQIRYPNDKLRIYLLDDGSTDEKCGDADRQRRIFH